MKNLYKKNIFSFAAVLFLAGVCFFFAPLSFVSAQTKRMVYVARFVGLKSSDSASTAKRLQEGIAKALQKKGFSVKKISQDAEAFLSQKPALEKGAALVGGQYTRSRSGQLDLYAQIYNPATGKIIDALHEKSLYDQLSGIEGIAKELSDLKLKDDEAIARFSQNVALRLKTNPRLRLRPQNLREQLTGTSVGKRFQHRVSEKSEELAAKETFALMEEQVVTTATRTATTLKEAPAAIYVVNSRQIRERGYRTLVDALHDVPGFDIIHVYGIFPELIHQRGLVGNNQRTLLYVNGVLDNNITENAILAGNLRFPLQNVKRIEVVAGPASALYGANAFNGVINIITNDGSDGNVKEFEVTHGYYESGLSRPGTGASLIARGVLGPKDAEAKDRVSYSVQAYYYQTIGPYFGDVGRLEKKDYNTLENRYDIEYQTERQLCGGQCFPDSSSIGYYWSPLFNVADEDTYNITANFRIGNFRFQTVNWQYLQGDGTFANGTQQIDTRTDDFYGSNWDFRNNSATLGYLYEISDKLELDSELTARHTEILSSSFEEYPATNGPDPQYRLLKDHPLAKNESKYDTTFIKDYARPDYAYNLREQLSYTASRNANTILGAEASYYDVPRGYGDNKRYVYTNYAGYAQQFWRIWQPFSITAGYRYDQSTIYGVSNTPRVGAVWNLTDNLTFKTFLSSGFRGPTPWESFNETKQRKANRNLRPERMRTAEVGLAYRFFKNYYMSLQYYQTRITDLLLEVSTNEPNPNDPGTNWNQNQNVGKARIEGAELTSDFRFTRSFSVYVNYTYSKGEYYDLPLTVTTSPSTRGRPLDDPVLDYVNANIVPTINSALNLNLNLVPEHGPIPNIASNKVAFGFTWYFFQKFSWHLRGNYVDIRRTIASNPETSVEGYLLAHTNLRWEDAFGLKDFYMQFMVRNLGDERFYDPGIRSATGGYYPTRHPIEGRNIWLTLGYRF